ncbi:hypothetical protein NQ317_014191 [Molorchus minor]|uniref:Uncharacterized protein n=1 Tax=Molorchus minor TaxID=1323400 RepID=A0ABQ9JIT7_9CUCU|nr:hypothetical protein NQ317_014191 [Molorchus minor]
MKSPDKPQQQPAPIVYSFGQSDYSTKYLPTINAVNSVNNHSRALPTKKITWGMGNNFEYEDDFADILGFCIKIDAYRISIVVVFSGPMGKITPIHKTLNAKNVPLIFSVTFPAPTYGRKGYMIFISTKRNLASQISFEVNIAWFVVA